MARGGPYDLLPACGCWYPVPSNGIWRAEKKYLAQVQLSSSTKILATTSRTTLKQTFVNTETSKLEEVHYTFPLYDGVSVVGFTCTVGSKTIVGVVKEKQQAKVEYQEAVARGETAGLLQQLPEARDVFTTSIGNIPPNERVLVEIVYLGELKHDAETDGSRFTLPAAIAPRYGAVSTESQALLSGTNASDNDGISISIDVILEEGSVIRGLQSPSHPIAVTVGRTSEMDEDHFSNNHASATLTLGTATLDTDFVVVVLAKGTDTPRALLETHPRLTNQRALMATLVPKFNIPNISPEIVFIVDRSGSMCGKIEPLVTAMKIFLKSLPVGVKFNICSFGSHHSFLFNKSKTYDQSSLQEALKHLETFDANFGGTEMLQPVKATVKNRYKDLPLEAMILTDGEIWNQEELFNFINATDNARFFTLGIGSGASSALVEGIARAGNGFAQFVANDEKMDKRVVRMLKGALTPHVTDYKLEVNYESEGAISADDDFEMVQSEKPSPPRTLVAGLKKLVQKKPISLFDTNATEEPTNPPAGRYDGLPVIQTPKVLQAPDQIPGLFPFNRTTVYLILGPDAPQQIPKSVVLRGMSEHGPLELEIPVQDVGAGETIHQMAAKKAAQELEDGRGWITKATNADGKLLKTAHEGKWDLIVEREAVNLGVRFQVGGKWCSFVAVEKKPGDVGGNPPEYSEKEQKTVYAGNDSAQSVIPRPASGAGLFGFGTGGFGGTNSQNASSPSGGLFGRGPHSAIQSPFSGPRSASTGGSLFSNNFSGPGSGLFGVNAKSSSGGLFGSAISPWAPNFGGSLFGSTVDHSPLTGPRNLFQTNSMSGSAIPAGATQQRNSPATIPSHGSSLFSLLPQPPADKSSSDIAEADDLSFHIASSISGMERFEGNFNLDFSTVEPSDTLADIEPLSEDSLANYLEDPDDSIFRPLPSADASALNPVALELELAEGPLADPVTGAMQASKRSRKSSLLGGGPPQMSSSDQSKGAPQMMSFGAAPSMASPPPPPSAPAGRAAPRKQLASFAARRSVPDSSSLQQYQTGTMLLEQQNKKRLMMARQEPAPATAAVGGAPAFDAFAQQAPGVSPAPTPAAKPKSARGGGGVSAIEQLPAQAARKSAPHFGPIVVPPRGSSDEEDDGEGEDDRLDTQLELELELDTATDRAAPTPTRSASNKMHALIELQTFDGSWQSFAALFTLLGVEKVKASALAAGRDGSVAATALAIAWLRKHVRDEEDVWDMVVEKAHGWLDAKIGADEARKIIEDAEKAV